MALQAPDIYTHPPAEIMHPGPPVVVPSLRIAERARRLQSLLRLAFEQAFQAANRMAVAQTAHTENWQHRSTIIG